MKNQVLRFLFTLSIIAFFSFDAHSDSASVTKALKKFMPDTQFDGVSESKMPGLYEVVMGPKLFYVSEDARYLIQGTMLDLETKENLTEAKVAKARNGAISKVGTDKMIVFKPKKPKHTVSIFTDIDCGYCRKLHSEIDSYMSEGITIQYLFYPRAGEGSNSFDKAVSVWCSDDRNDALTKAKKGGDPKVKTCDNPVLEHMALAQALEVRGTPMIVTEFGDVLPGYVPAQQLSEYLEKLSE